MGKLENWKSKLEKPNQGTGTMKPPDKGITFKSHKESRNEFKRKVAEIKAENLREVTPLPGTEVTVANHNRAQTALNVFAPLGYIERCDTSPIMQVPWSP